VPDNETMHVLVVDDDEAVRKSIHRALLHDGYDVSLAADGGSAIEQVVARRPDAIVLDVLMPEPNGLEVCRMLRARRDLTPILMLTARDLVTDRVAGLDAGADDYLVKPFALDELRARLRALLRRSGVAAETLEFADIQLDPVACLASRAGQPLSLTKTELSLLELFLRNPGRVLSHTFILESVWGYDFGSNSNALWVYVSYLRSKLEADGAARVIQTVRGLGYVLRDRP
jgi:two-component system, OmpR family, response regulator MprA